MHKLGVFCTLFHGADMVISDQSEVAKERTHMKRPYDYVNTPIWAFSVSRVKWLKREHTYKEALWLCEYPNLGFLSDQSEVTKETTNIKEALWQCGYPNLDLLSDQSEVTSEKANIKRALQQCGYPNWAFSVTRVKWLNMLKRRQTSKGPYPTQLGFPQGY